MAVEDKEKPKAKLRRLSNLRRGTRRDSEISQRKIGKSVDKACAVAGMSRTTFRKGREILIAAEADPDNYEDLPTKMNQQGVAPAYQELQRRQGKAPQIMKDLLWEADGAIKRNNSAPTILRQLVALVTKDPSKQAVIIPTLKCLVKLLKRAPQKE
jgi:hypothetical protein